MAEIAVMVLSPIIQVFFEKMASGQFVDFFRRRKLNDNLLVRLTTQLRSVNEVLKDAEDKQFTMTNVKEWVDAVYDAVYDAEQVLDEISTKAQQHELDVESGTFRSKVRNFIPTSSFVKKVEKQIEDLLVKLDRLANNKEILGLKKGEGVEGNPSERLPSTSLVEESHTFGRHDDKEEVINLLLSDGAFGNEMGVIAIVGMGGIGKTTLAQLVYNDIRLNEHFDHKAWVCVSVDFDVQKLTKTIVEKVTQKTPDTNDLDELQRKLKEELMKKKFLIVLDDVWNKKLDYWEHLRKPFIFGAQGSRVIVTTRNEEVASVMRARSYTLNELPKEYCWSLFAKYAFHEVNLHEYPNLEEIGRQIVKKCNGLPLAIKTIGAFLRPNLDSKEWHMVLKSDLWDYPFMETDIIPALKLSYKYLSPSLRRCFAYCSIFPKYHAFKKDKLVYLWMAEGFLPQQQNKTIKEVGDDYFLALVSRSLFQRSEYDEYVMHDFVSDLTKFISKKFTLCQEDNNSHEILSKIRHFSYSSEKFDIKKFETLNKAMRLRTIVLFEEYFLFHSGTKFLLPKIRGLRVLVLSHLDLSELPVTIGKFKQLRYLDLTHTLIEKLPDSICKLCNLQILNLSYCNSLVALPRDLYKLINLHHLDIAETKIMEMPINLSKLKSLQTLSTYVVSKRNGSAIEELGKLTNLRGSLSVLELQNIESPADAKDVNLRDKSLEELKLKWRVDTNALGSQEVLLHYLEPNSTLRSLSIDSYGGTSFPNWVGDASFSNIAFLRLENCKFCCSLPPLGQLPSLQRLSIVGFDGVVTVDRQFYGSRSSSMKPFGVLKYLRFEKMLKWKEWIPFEAENESRAFPNLIELSISNCPKLTRGLPVHLPSLVQLFIDNCPQLVASLFGASSLRKLTVKNCNEFILNESSSGTSSRHEVMLSNCKTVILNESPSGTRHEVTLSNCNTVELNEELSIQFSKLEMNHPMYLKYYSSRESSSGTSSRHEVRLSNCNTVTLNESPSGIQELNIQYSKLEFPMHLNHSSLECLTLENCSSPKSFPLFSKIRQLIISYCGDLESLTVGEQREHGLLLSQMQIYDCPNFAYFPQGGLSALNLKDLSISYCSSLRSLPDNMHILLPSLEILHISHCRQVESFPEGGLPSNLNEISIFCCDKLFANRMGWGLQNLSCVRRFSISDKSEDVESFPEEGLLPTSLTYLYIGAFPELKSLEKKGLQHLTALEELRIEFCHELKCMPEDGLPASLSILRIDHCPLLTKELESKEGPEWRKIAHVPNKHIN